MIQTANGGRAAVGRGLCRDSVGYELNRHERQAILLREAQYKERRKALPKRKAPAHTKPGPVSWYQF